VRKSLKSVNIWQSYKQERDCLVHFVRLANALLKDSLVACFADINVSQGNVATYARCGGVFNVCKSVKTWQNYDHESVAPFLVYPVDKY